MKVRALIGMMVFGAAMTQSAFAQNGAPGKPAKPAPAPAAAPAAAPAKPAEKVAAEKAAVAKDASEKAAEPSMADYAKANAPNENHKLLEQLAGNWDAAVKSRMAAEAPWMDSKGTAYIQMWYGGRYAYMTFNGDMGGMEFKGAGFTGYNNGTKQFEQSWVDSMGTGVVSMTGSYDAAKKTFTFNGDMVDAVDSKKKHMRQQIRIESPDKHVEEFYGPGADGKEFKTMEITYTRKVKADKEDAKAEKAGGKKDEPKKDEPKKK